MNRLVLLALLLVLLQGCALFELPGKVVDAVSPWDDGHGRGCNCADCEKDREED